MYIYICRFHMQHFSSLHKIEKNDLKNHVSKDGNKIYIIIFNTTEFSTIICAIIILLETKQTYKTFFINYFYDSNESRSRKFLSFSLCYMRTHKIYLTHFNLFTYYSVYFNLLYIFSSFNNQQAFSFIKWDSKSDRSKTHISLLKSSREKNRIQLDLA